MPKKTLKQYLEDFGLSKGSEDVFMVRDRNTDLVVSYRYLCSPAMRSYLDRAVKRVTYGPTALGDYTIFILEEGN